MFIVNSVLVKPIIECDFEVNVISEISWTSRSHEELRFIRNGVIDVELLASPLVVFTKKSEVKCVLLIKIKLLLVSWEACLSLDKNIILLIKYYIQKY
jgi:hypothetical protein